MSTTRSQKQLRETTGETTDSESPAKRQKLTRNLQLLYGEVKEKSQLLDAQLGELLKILPTDESTASGRKDIQGVQELLETITTTGEVEQSCALVFEEDFGTLFPEEVIANLSCRG